jgi:hypothetical protein
MWAGGLRGRTDESLELYRHSTDKATSRKSSAILVESVAANVTLAEPPEADRIHLADSAFSHAAECRKELQQLQAVLDSPAAASEEARQLLECLDQHIRSIEAETGKLRAQYDEVPEQPARAERDYLPFTSIVAERSSHDIGLVLSRDPGNIESPSRRRSTGLAASAVVLATLAALAVLVSIHLPSALHSRPGASRVIRPGPGDDACRNGFTGSRGKRLFARRGPAGRSSLPVTRPGSEGCAGSRPQGKRSLRPRCLPF